MSMKDDFYSRIGAVSLQRYNALAASMAVVLNRSTGESPQEVASKMRVEAQELADLSLLMGDDIAKVRARLRQLEDRRAHVDSVAKTVSASAEALEELPSVRYTLDAEFMGDDMPGAEYEVVWSAANAPADEVDESGDLIVGSRDIVTGENEE